jgi:hypothetical protein
MLVSVSRTRFKLHAVPALFRASVVLFASLAVDAISHSLFPHSFPTVLLSDVAACGLAFAFFLAQSLSHDEKIAAVEVYQAHAYLQNIKIVNALQKIQNAIDLCAECDANACERKAHVRQQVRVIRDALNIRHPGPPAPLKGELRVFSGGNWAKPI